MKSLPDEHTDSLAPGEGVLAGLSEDMMHYPGARIPDALYKPAEMFPGMIFRRLAAGVIIGSIVGLVLGSLLYVGIVTIPRAEELYPMGPVAFHCFWAFKGISAGMACFGIWGITAEPEQIWGEKENNCGSSYYYSLGILTPDRPAEPICPGRTSFGAPVRDSENSFH